MKREAEDDHQDLNGNQIVNSELDESENIKIEAELIIDISEIEKNKDLPEKIPKIDSQEVQSDTESKQTSSSEALNGHLKSELTESETSQTSSKSEKMERQNYRDGPINPPKRQRRSEEIDEIRLLIKSSIAGGVIGKGGHNIQKLRTIQNVKLNIVDCRGPERVITIAGEMEVCCDVIREILKQFESINGNEYDLRILVHQSLAGCVIGVSGAKIKDIKEKTGCRLKIFSEHTPQSTDRVIQIVGSENQCIQTLLEIYDLIRGTAPRGPIHNYDPNNYNEFHANDYGGFGVSTKSVARSNIQSRNRFDDRRGNNMRFNRGENRARPFEYVSPWAQNRSRAGFSSYQPSSPFYQPTSPSYQPSNPFYQPISPSYKPTSPAYQPTNPFYIPSSPPYNKEKSTSTRVSVPNDMAGALIGKRGDRIRRIRSEVSGKFSCILEINIS